MNFEMLDGLWKRRFNPDDLLNGHRLVEAYSRETTEVEERYELDWRRARECHFNGMQRLENGDKKVARRTFERGTDLAQWTLDGAPQRVEGRFWWAVNCLEMGRAGLKLQAYWAIRGARPQLERAAELDESFHFAGPLRVLGRLTHLAPRSAGGDGEKSHAYFTRALEIADNSTTRLYFGELLRDLGDLNAAKTQFEAILAAPDDEDWMWEQARDREKARAELMGG